MARNGGDTKPSSGAGFPGGNYLGQPIEMVKLAEISLWNGLQRLNKNFVQPSAQNHSI